MLPSIGVDLATALERAASLSEPTRKGWTAPTLKALGVGKDAAARYVFPIRDEAGERVGVVRYADDGREPKARADKDSARDLFPRPEDTGGEWVAVVEGEPDAVSAAELGLPAVAIPGVGKWTTDWVERIASHRDAVFLIPDCDTPGRKRMRQLADALSHHVPTFLLELDQLRDDGYDVGDLLMDYGTVQAKEILSSLFDAARQYVPDRPTVEEFTRASTPPADDDGRVAVWTRASDVQIQAVRFLWRPWLPLGKVTILAGAPGTGKSQLTAFIAAQTTRAGFYESDVSEPGTAVIMTAEDDLDDTVVPRLQAAGADLSRVEFVNMRRTLPTGITADGMIRLPGDVATLQARLEAGDVRLVVLDPVASFVGREHSTYVNQDVRDVLDPVVALAARYGVAVVLVLHLNKSESKSWAGKIAESHAFQAVARTVLALAPDPDDEDGIDGTDKILAATKANVAKVGRQAVKLTVKPATVYASDMTPVDTSIIEITGASSIAADDLLADATERGSRRQVLDFLLEILAAGPMESKALQRASKEAGVAWRSVERYYREVCKPAKPAMSRGPWVYELQDRLIPTHTPGGHGGHGDDDESKSANPATGVSREVADTDISANGQTTLGDLGGQTVDELREYRKRRDAMLGERWDEDD